MVMALFRAMFRSDPQYLAVSVREAKYTCLGYRTKLSRLHTLDPPI
jgi:type IV secretory pathway TrbD component